MASAYPAPGGGESGGPRGGVGGHVAAPEDHKGSTWTVSDLESALRAAVTKVPPPTTAVWYFNRGPEGIEVLLGASPELEGQHPPHPPALNPGGERSLGVSPAGP